MSCDGWCLSVSHIKAMSKPDGEFSMSASMCLCNLYASLIWRLTLFLSTACRKRLLETETRMRIPASSVCLYTMRIGYADRDLLSVLVKRASIAFLLQSLSVFFRPKPLSIMLFQICIQGCSDAGVFGRGSLKVQSQSCICNTFCRGRAECGNSCFSLVIVREIL